MSRFDTKRGVDDDEMESYGGKRMTNVRPEFSRYGTTMVQTDQPLLPYPIFGMNLPLPPERPPRVEEYLASIQNVSIIEARRNPLYKTSANYREAVETHSRRMWASHVTNNNLDVRLDDDIPCWIYNSIQTGEDLANWINVGIPEICNDDEGNFPITNVALRLGAPIAQELIALGYSISPIDYWNDDPDEFIMYWNALKAVVNSDLAEEPLQTQEDESNEYESMASNDEYNYALKYIKYLGLKLARSYVATLPAIDPMTKYYQRALRKYSADNIRTVFHRRENYNEMLNQMYPAGTETPGVQPFDPVQFGRLLLQAQSLEDLQSLVQQYGHRFGVYSNSENREFTMASVAAFLGEDALDFAIRFPGEMPTATTKLGSIEYLCARVLQNPLRGDVFAACSRVQDLRNTISNDFRQL